MRVGVITSHFVPNYGAALQTYALCRALTEMQHDVRVIDYRPQEISSKHRIAGAGPTGGKARGMLRALLRYSLGAPRTYVERKRKRAAIARFASQYIPITDVTYTSDACFEASPPGFDAYICGSDQIWNPNMHGFLPAYYLHFVPEGTARIIAYAPSFGELSIESEYTPKIATLLKRFDHLSVREKSGQSFIEGLIGRTAEHVLDPALLLEDYSAITVEPDRRSDFIAVYAVEPSPEMVATVATLKAQLGLRVVSLGGPLPGADEYKGTLGPRQWLGYLRRCQYVCTNSYHGTIMAIQFGKGFVSVPRGTDNVRIGDLLQRLGLLGRRVDDPTEAGLGARLREPIAYDEVSETLTRLRQDSLGYLRRALAQ